MRSCWHMAQSKNPLAPTAASDVLLRVQQLVPAALATLAPVIQFPGRQLTGKSVIDSLSDKQPKRIPTVFNPFYSGFKFRLVARESPPGTTLHFSNMTLMVQNATYDSLATSGVMDFFEFGDSARVCITNRCDAGLAAGNVVSCLADAFATGSRAHSRRRRYASMYRRLALLVS